MPDLVTMLTTPPWKLWYSAEAPIALTCTSCMMSGLGKSHTPPFDTAEMSTPSYWNWFWSLLDPKMMNRESLGTWLMRTAGAKVTTSKYDCRAVGMFCSSVWVKLVEKPALAASTTGASPVTVTACSSAPTSMPMSTWMMRPTSTRRLSRCTVVKPAIS